MTTEPSSEIAKTEPTDAKRELPHTKFDTNKTGTLDVGVSGDFGRINEGAGNTIVTSGVIIHLANLGSKGKRSDQDATNFALAFLDSLAPKDAAETLLITQMAAIHQATMMMAQRLNHVETIVQQDSAERAVNKLARTFAMQVEALKRYRTGGQQRVVVEHVTVNAGGQAIVGTVNRGEGVKAE